MMEMEADRMVNLQPGRAGGGDRARGDHRRAPLAHREQPIQHPVEQMSAALYQNHPYRIPIIGWMHEMKKLSREDALDLLQALLCAQQRHRGGGRRRRRRGGEGRWPEAAYGSSPANAAIKSASAARGARASRAAPRRAEGPARAATPRCAASTWRPATPRPTRERPRRSTC